EALGTGRQAIDSSAAPPVASGSSRTTTEGRQNHVESEIGRGYGPLSLTSELASMRARLVVESGRWSDMKGQGTFDNVDELFALGLSSAKLGDLARADVALEHLGK